MSDDGITVTYHCPQEGEEDSARMERQEIVDRLRAVCDIFSEMETRQERVAAMRWLCEFLSLDSRG